MPEFLKKSFVEAVEATTDLNGCYQQGMGAFLRHHRGKVVLLDSRACEGSVDIDICVKLKYPNDSRWDYCFAYKGDVFFVEVHMANSNEVSAVIKKLTWLKDWLNQKAPEINN